MKSDGLTQKVIMAAVAVVVILVLQRMCSSDLGFPGKVIAAQEISSRGNK